MPSPPPSSHTRTAYSLTSTEWKSIKRFGVLWGVKQYNLNPKRLAEVCFIKGDAAYKMKGNAEGNEFMNMVKDLVREFPDAFTEDPKTVAVSVAVDESKAEGKSMTKANTAKQAQAEGLGDVARCLLDGTDPNAQSQSGTLLHRAVTYSKTLTVVQALLDAGADLNVQDKNGFTPLHRAAMYSEIPEIVQALLDAGADLNARDKGGLTPLHRAAVGSREPAVVQILLDAGADPNVRDKNGFTPLYWAKQSYKNPVVVELLILNQRENKPTIAEAEVRARAKTNATIKVKVGASILTLALTIALSIGINIQHKKGFHNAVAKLKNHNLKGEERERVWHRGTSGKDEQGRRYIDFPGQSRIYADLPCPSDNSDNRELIRVREAGWKVQSNIIQYLDHANTIVDANTIIDANTINDVSDSRLEKIYKKLEKSLQLNCYNKTDPELVKEAMEEVVEARRLVAQVRKDHRERIRVWELITIEFFFNHIYRQYAHPSEENAFDDLARKAEHSIDRDDNDFESYLRRLKRKSFQIRWRCPIRNHPKMGGRYPDCRSWTGRR